MELRESPETKTEKKEIKRHEELIYLPNFRKQKNRKTAKR